jgi:hypothetical protein
LLLLLCRPIQASMSMTRVMQQQHLVHSDSTDIAIRY